MVLIMVAMQDEFDGVITHVDVTEKNDFPFYYIGKIQNKKVIIAKSGIGKVNASAILTFILNKFSIDLIINIGFAGAIGNYEAGEVVLINSAQYFDVDNTVWGYNIGQIPQMPSKYENTISIGLFKKETLYTSDSFISSAPSSIVSAIFDMEGCALLQTGYLFNRKILMIKIISDIINSQNHIDFLDFISIGKMVISKTINEVLLLLP